MKGNELIQAVCEDLYNITGIKTVLYDADMKFIYSHPCTMSGFCIEVRKNKSFREKCLHCDRLGFEHCKKSGDICIYRCHMGLTEAVAPIIDSGIVIGYLMFGQIVSAGERPKVQERILQSSQIQEKQVFLQLLEEIEEKNNAQIRAAVRIITMCACYIRLNNILNVQKENLALHIGQYVQSNIADINLGIQSICREFSISRGTLYNLSKKSLGMGITQYIRSMRLKRAMELLNTKDVPVYRIAEECGIGDVNYFIKLVKKATGKTPKQIQAESENDSKEKD